MNQDTNELSRSGSANNGKQAWGNSGKPPQAPSETPYVNNKDRQANKGCWAAFSGCIGGMWATRQMAKHGDREIYVRTTLRELFVYIIFLAIMCVITFGMTSPTMFYFTQALNSLYLNTPFTDVITKQFMDSDEVMDFWRFMQQVFPDTTYWEFWYDPQKTPTQEQDRNILYENRMLGVPRMRQVRVQNNSCTVPPDFQRVIIQCYAGYSAAAEDTQPYGPENDTSWTYTSQDDLDGSTFWAQLAVYGGGGYFVDFSTFKNETEVIINSLRENLWIDRGTRAVFVDLTVYNANINLFCIIKFIFEFPATGGVIPTALFKTVKLLRYVTPFDYFVLACELVFTFFIIYYIVEEVLELAALKFRYFNSMWNILDLLVIGLALLCIGLDVYCVTKVQGTLQELLSYPDQFADFEKLGYWQSQFNSAVAVCVFFSWFKLFKYISFNKTMTQLSSTLSRCAKDVAGFAVMFFIVFFAFAQLGYLLFGTQVQDFSSFITAIFTLLRTILGDFNFQAIQDANRILGPIFFLSYVFFVFFVLLNMFLAIINDTYSEVKFEIAHQRNEFEIADYFKRGYNNMLGKFGHRDKIIDIENALKLSDGSGDGMLTFDEVRRNLKKCNFSDMEIEMFFARYDIDGDRLLEPDEVKGMLADLEGRRNDIDQKIIKPISVNEQPQGTGGSERQRSARSARGRPTTGGSVNGVSQDEILVLTKRVDRMEHSIGAIVNKIDIVLLKLDSMEKSKSKRKEQMGKLMDDMLEDKALDAQNPRQNLEALILKELQSWEEDPVI